ncbi:MAG: sarcosine oxidase subunit gamma [Betaproteobacteria bacterium]|nr:sarcosine oxidase subunit gamma [Betaproteobacteria bacterium]
MADSGQARRFAGRNLVIEERPGRACIDLRGDPNDARFARAVESVTDLRLPLEAGTCESGLLASILWLGPDQWLVSSDTQSGEALTASLRAALRGIASAVVDVSHARIVYAVGGSNARAVLAKGCSLDLHEREFPVGRCAQTLLAKVPILVHRASTEPTFEIHVARSFRDYAWAWLQAAASEYAAEAGAV